MALLSSKESGRRALVKKKQTQVAGGGSGFGGSSQEDEQEQPNTGGKALTVCCFPEQGFSRFHAERAEEWAKCNPARKNSPEGFSGNFQFDRDRRPKPRVEDGRARAGGPVRKSTA